MKVFWVVSFIPNGIFKSHKKEISGGWIESMRKQLCLNPKIELFLVFKTHLNQLKCGRCFDTCNYFGIPESNYEERFSQLVFNHSPDVIHIWGTEFEISYQTVKVLKGTVFERRCVTSLQGLVSEICKCFTTGLPSYVINRKTFYEKFRKCGILDRVNSFKNRSFYELYCIKNSRYVLGRTDWDKNIVYKYSNASKYIKIPWCSGGRCGRERGSFPCC